MTSEQTPEGLTRDKVDVGGLGIDYVTGGSGPTLVLLHGYPQTWYEWRHVLPALAEHYTVVAPSLRGAGRSDAPPAGYDKKTMAADIHGLLVALGLDSRVRMVGHDIGTMVAYAYAVAHPDEVTKLVLSEAPIPDPAIYSFPSLTPDGPGAWHFGFFNLANGFADELIAGNEKLWVTKFIDALEMIKGSVTDEDISIYAEYLSDPAHLRANLAWFRSLPQDMADNTEFGKTKLAMPVLAIGAEGSLADFVGIQVKNYASDVTPAVIAGAGHWIYEERPDEMTQVLLTFLHTDDG
ncbi:alpha/beta fold hydrolase [Mycolicibacterium psychrotolerans]|uniref:Dehalogenase n=1 Tax=Mycolicibacterium psychrotolerans TaxID=216929 RepID=A0A7I7MBF4_9MYCO|nr:alpha/beta hydrolase [Mycolicibacterium psychrotolerans]BBX69167.1 dehalogenase [Mycolicibacterium psychrotolerans]